MPLLLFLLEKIHVTLALDLQSTDLEMKLLEKNIKTFSVYSLLLN